MNDRTIAPGAAPEYLVLYIFFMFLSKYRFKNKICHFVYENDLRSSTVRKREEFNETPAPLFAALVGLSGPALAANYPAKPVHIVVPTAAGGGADLAGVDAKIVARLHDEVVAILNAPDARQKLIAVGFEPVGSTPEAFAAQLGDEVKKWSEIAKQAGIIGK